METVDGETIRSLIRRRPLYLEILQEIFGQKIWNGLEESFTEFCLENNQDEKAIRSRLTHLPKLPATEDWTQAPLYKVADFLTEEHREFRSKDIHNINELLKAYSLDMGQDGDSLRDLVQSFQNFRNDFLSHMEEEEDFLFLKIVRTEACLRYPSLYPEVFKGSITMYPSSLLHTMEAEFAQMVLDLITKAESLKPTSHSKVKLDALIETLKAYDAKIRAHANLEAELLFPKARKMEADLKKRAENDKI